MATNPDCPQAVSRGSRPSVPGLYAAACPHPNPQIWYNVGMFYVYVLRSQKDGDLYIGSTNDLKVRFAMHNEGKITSTQSRRPFELIYYEAYKAEPDARHREQMLKLGSRALAQLKKRLSNSLL